MKKTDKLIEFDNGFLKEALSFLNTYYILDINLDSMFKFSCREKINLLKLKSIYSKIKLASDLDTIELSYISSDDAIKICNEFLVKLLPNKKESILHLDKLIEFNNYLNGEIFLNYTLSKDNIIVNNITLPSDFSLYDVSAMVHEKTHAITFYNLDLVSLFQNGLELFPMLFQKIILMDMNDNNLINYDRIIRTTDTMECFFNLATIKYIEKNAKDKVSGQIISDYFYIKSYDYLLSHIYSSLLAKYYQLDKETMIERLNTLFDKKITIEDFLDSYNINLLNKELILTTKEEINKCKKIIIRR